MRFTSSNHADGAILNRSIPIETTFSVTAIA
jgi:hypothetical protein